MTWWKLAAISVFAIGCSTATGQVRPSPGLGDPRLQTVAYDPGQVVQLRGAPGYQLTVQLSPDEQVQSVALGDSGGWQVSVNKAGDHLFIKPTGTGAFTNMTVITSVRVYNFDLVALTGPNPEIAYTVQFQYPAEGQPNPAAATPAALKPRIGRYRIEGDKSLRPSSVAEDGARTIVSWPADQVIPATFEIGDDGQERLVNGGMKGDQFVIDGVAKKLVFRIDQRTAYATRQRPERSR